MAVVVIIIIYMDYNTVKQENYATPGIFYPIKVKVLKVKRFKVKI